MRMDWIVSPVAIYAVIALGMFLCLALFCSLKRDVYRVRTAGKDSDAALASQIGSVQSSMETLQGKVEEIGMRPSTAPNGINLNRRMQVLRMYGRGEQLETISAALNAPRNEIDLLIRVQKMVKANPRHCSE